MILYHGSDQEIKKPKIIKGTQGKDFGFAFYLTPLKEQAEKQARRKALFNKTHKRIVTVFEWDENVENFSFKRFTTYSLDWLELVINCRKNIEYKHEYDIVEGNIADDAVGETINFVCEGVMRKEDALEKLKFQNKNIQIAFCTEKSLKSLKFLKSYEVK